MSSTWSSLHHGEHAAVKTSVDGNVTGTTALTVWAVASNKTFILRGWSLAFFSSTTGGNDHNLVFADGSVSAIGPGIIGVDASAGVVGKDKEKIPGGWQSGTQGNDLVIVADQDASTHVVHVSGLIWGDYLEDL